MEQLWFAAAGDAEEKQQKKIVGEEQEEEQQRSDMKFEQRVLPGQRRRGGRPGFANGANRSFGLCQP
jgi:hypothetical protein